MLVQALVLVVDEFEGGFVEGVGVGGEGGHAERRAVVGGCWFVWVGWEFGGFAEFGMGWMVVWRLWKKTSLHYRWHYLCLYREFSPSIGGLRWMDAVCGKMTNLRCMYYRAALTPPFETHTTATAVTPSAKTQTNALVTPLRETIRNPSGESHHSSGRSRGDISCGRLCRVIGCDHGCRRTPPISTKTSLLSSNITF